MTDYVQQINFAVKDDLATNDPNKIIRGVDFDVEFSEVSAAIATKTETLPVIPAYEYESRDGTQLPIAGIDIESNLDIVSTTFTPLDANNRVLVEGYIGFNISMGAGETNPSDDRIPVNCVITNNETTNSFPYGDIIEYRVGRSFGGTNQFNSTSDDRRALRSYMYLDSDDLVSIAGTSNAGYTFTLRTATVTEIDFLVVDSIRWESSIIVKELR